MANITKYGVSYDFSQPYDYEVCGVTFRFSSRPHLEKFIAGVTPRMRGVSSSLERRFKYGVDASLIAVFQFYSQVETRGYYVVINEVVYRSSAFVKFKLVIDDA